MEESKKKRVYLSGPMTGIEEHNYPAFTAAAKCLREDFKYEVINPAENFGGDRTRALEEYLRHDLSQILSEGIDEVLVLPGWEESEGARLEVLVARSVGIPARTLSFHGTIGWHIKGTYNPDRKAYDLDDRESNDRIWVQHRAMGLDAPPLGQRPSLADELLIEKIVSSPDYTGEITRQVLNDVAAGLAPKPYQESILDEAQRIVNGARRRDYGHPRDNFRRIGEMWGVILEPFIRDQVADFLVETGDGYSIATAQSRAEAWINDMAHTVVPNRIVGQMMIALKIARDIQTPKRDNLVDAAGYAEATDLATREEETA